MKASKFTDAQKAFIIKQGEDGTPVAEVCRKAGISQATYFNWKKKYAGLMPSEMKRLKQLEDENGRLKRIVRTFSNESSEACPEENAGRRHAIAVGCIDPQGLPSSVLRSQKLPLQITSARTGWIRTAHQRDLSDAGPLWIPPRLCTFTPGGLDRESQEGSAHL